MVTDNGITRTSASILPDDLEAMAPGPRLATLLASVDRSRLSDHDAVRLMVARDKLASQLQAERAADIAEVARRAGDDDLGEFAVLEVATALRLTRRAAEHELAFATAVTERLPQLAELLDAGHIDVRRARVLAEGTAHLSVEVARRVVADLADRAGSLTTGQLRARLRRLCVTVDPDEAAARVRHALQARRVFLEATASGSANLLLLDLPPDLAAGALAHVDTLARTLPDDGRTIDQRRADAALLLLSGHGTPVGRGVVDITVDLRTLLGLAESPGELGGWGPVVSDIARQVAGRQIDCMWQSTVVDDNGDPHAVAVRRRPTTSQARQVRARHPRCVFPGCRRPARSADLDHTIRHTDGGPTLEDNVAPLCRFHHRAKDEGGWKYHRRSEGDLVWTSPFGHRYVTADRAP